MTVDFETNGNELILVYTPERGSEDITLGFSQVVFP